jgi:hypothetical protein
VIRILPVQPVRIGEHGGRLLKGYPMLLVVDLRLPGIPREDVSVYTLFLRPWRGFSSHHLLAEIQRPQYGNGHRSGLARGRRPLFFSKRLIPEDALLTEWTYFGSVLATALAIPEEETPGWRAASEWVAFSVSFVLVSGLGRLQGD